MSGSCDPLDCSRPGSSLCGISQARIPEWVATSFSRRSFWSRDWTCVCCAAGRFFTAKPPGKGILGKIKDYLEQKTGSKSQLSNIITFIFGDFPVGSDGKESACIAGDPGSIPGSGGTPGVGNDSSVPYSCPENSTDRVLGRLQSMGLHCLTRLSNQHTHTVSAFRHTAVTKVQKSEG